MRKVIYAILIVIAVLAVMRTCVPTVDACAAKGPLAPAGNDVGQSEMP
ncbi:hypothetical protein [Microbulbifer sediminum]|nr:hypothetical protein [Microbulbifer sediminum]